MIKKGKEKRQSFVQRSFSSKMDFRTRKKKSKAIRRKATTHIVLEMTWKLLKTTHCVFILRWTDDTAIPIVRQKNSSATSIELKLRPQIFQLCQNVHKMTRMFWQICIKYLSKSDIVNFHSDVVCYSEMKTPTMQIKMDARGKYLISVPLMGGRHRPRPCCFPLVFQAHGFSRLWQFCKLSWLRASYRSITNRSAQRHERPQECSYNADLENSSVQ